MSAVTTAVEGGAVLLPSVRGGSFRARDPRRIPVALAAAAVALALLACESRPRVDPPDLEGYQTLLYGPPGATALRVVRLPAPELALALPGEALDGAHGHLLLYRRTVAELGLPLDEDVLTFDVGGEPLALPDAAWALDPTLTWQADEPSRWSARKVAAQRCLSVPIAAVPLAMGKPLFAARWGRPAVPEILVGLRDPEAAALHLWRVRTDGAERVPVELPAALGRDEYIRGDTDDAGHLWIAHAEEGGVVTGTTARVQDVVLTELDPALVVQRTVRLPLVLGSSDLAVQGLSVGNVGAQAEAFVLVMQLDRDRPPRVLRWRDGEAGATVLPWPSTDDVLAPCAGVGIFRSHLARSGPDEATFLFRQGTVQKWSGGTLRAERIERGICGGVLLDDALEPGSLALLQIDRPAEFPPPPPLLVRRNAEEDWTRIGEVNLANMLDLVRWRGRLMASGDGAQTYELRVRSTGVTVCEPLRAVPENNRMDRLIPMGDVMAGTGAAREGDVARVYWLGVD